MLSGRVKWWKDESGYGLIASDKDGTDVFVHHSSIQMSGRRTLAEGQLVFFDIATGRRGPEAKNVQPGKPRSRTASQTPAMDPAPVLASVEIFSGLRKRAARLAKTSGKPGGIEKPKEVKKLVFDEKERTTFFGMRRVVEKIQREEVVLRYWTLRWQVTMKLDEDPDRWTGPPDGDETRGWAVWLRDDGVLLHGEWSGGWEPGAPKGTFHSRPLTDIYFTAATDRELEKMDIRYRRLDRNCRPSKRFQVWEEVSRYAAGTGLADELTRLERHYAPE